MDGNKKSDGVCQAYWMKVTNGTVYVIGMTDVLYMPKFHHVAIYRSVHGALYELKAQSSHSRSNEAA